MIVGLTTKVKRRLTPLSYTVFTFSPKLETNRTFLYTPFALGTFIVPVKFLK